MSKKIYVLSIIGLLIFLSGCVETPDNDQDQVNGGDAEVEMSSVSFQVTDKVTEEFSHVNVTFSEIKLFKQMEDDESYIVVPLNKTVDLVYLNLNNINETLGVDEIEVGNYSKLWINVTKAIGVLNETPPVIKNITVPSGWLKIQQLHLFNISKGNHTITIDINLEESIHSFHGGEEYKFIPVISRIEHFHEHKLEFRENDQSKIKNMVGNRKPAIDITVNGTIVNNKIDLNASVDYIFNASSTLDLDGDELNYTWDFGDGSSDFGGEVIHSFTDINRTYQVWLVVSDGQEESREHFTVKIN